MSKWENPIEAKLSDIFEALERQALREQRNTRFILKVLQAQNEKLDALLAALPSGKRGVFEFGKPQPKSATPAAHPPKADKSKEK